MLVSAFLFLFIYFFLSQAGPLNEVKIAKERDGTSKGYAFIEFKHDVSVPYALHLLNGTSLYGKQLTLKFRKGSKHEQNPHQGPPAEAFPKGFPKPVAYNGPPNIQRAFPPLPIPNVHFDPTLAQGHAFETQWEGFRGSPVVDFYGSPSHQGSPHSFQGPYGQQTLDDSRPSSRGPFRGTPPGSRDHSPRWQGHDREEQRRGEYYEHQQDVDGRGSQRDRQFHRSDSYHTREERHHRREDSRQQRGRERSRTVDDHQRGFNGGQHNYRDRSEENYRRRNTGYRPNEGYRHHHQYR